MSWLAGLRDTIHNRLKAPPLTAQLETGAGVVAADAAPSTPPPTAIDGPTSLQVVLTWLRWLKSRRDTLQAIAEQTHALVDQAHAMELRLPKHGTTIPELIDRLEALALDYAEANGDALFKKSQTYAAPGGGSLTRRQQPITIELDGKPKDVGNHLAERLDVERLVAEFVAGDDELETIARLTRIKCEPDKAAAGKLYVDGKLTGEQLALAKLKAAGGGQNYKVEL